MNFVTILDNLSTFHWFLFALCGFLIGMNKGGVPAISMITIPIFAAIFGGKASTGIMLPILIAADSVAVRHYYKSVEWKRLFKILPSSIVGILIALVVGNNVDDEQFKNIIAITIFVCMIPMLWKSKKDSAITNSIYFATTMGLAGGFATMIGNAAGPILSIYLLTMHLPKNSFIATRALFFFSLNLFKLPLHIFNWNTITVETFSMDLLIMPIIVLGTMIGIWVVKHVQEKLYRNIVIVATLLSALLLLL